MTTTPRQALDPVPEPFVILPDFKPMHRLRPAACQEVVNQLFNLTMQAIQVMHRSGHEIQAQEMADQAHQALKEYDDDLANVVQLAVCDFRQWAPTAEPARPATTKIRL